MQLKNLVPGAELPSSTHIFTTVDLFLFSAAGWHPHRIHFDQDYARDVEGHPDILVHGPLQAVHLFQALTNELPAGATLVSVRYRHVKPLYVGVPARMKGTVVRAEQGSERVEVEVWMENAETGERTTVGQAVVRLPAST